MDKNKFIIPVFYMYLVEYKFCINLIYIIYFEIHKETSLKGKKYYIFDSISIRLPLRILLQISILYA